MNDLEIYSQDLLYSDTALFINTLINDLEYINNMDDETSKYINLKSLLEKLKEIE